MTPDDWQYPILSSLDQFDTFEITTESYAIRIVHVESGSTLGVDFSDDTFIVFWEGWHEHFEEIEEVSACVRSILTCQTRLQVTYWGDNPYKWCIQQRQDSNWANQSTTGYLFFPFWRRKSVKHISLKSKATQAV